MKGTGRTPCFDISLYFSLYFSSLQLMAVAPWLLRRGDALHRAHIISSLTHTLWHTPVCACVCTITLNALLSALVNPRLLLVVYKSKGHRASGGLWQSWHPILICFYLVSRMYPGQIWGNIAKCKSSAYNTPRITLQIKFWLQCVVCLFAKAVMLSTQMDPDRAMSPGSPQRVHIIGNIPAPGLEKHRAELIPHLLHVQ